MNSGFNANNMRGNMYSQGIISINARFDLLELNNRARVNAIDSPEYVKYGMKPTMDNEIITIQKYDLVFTCGTSSKNHIINGVGSSSVPVLSCLNGAYARVGRAANVKADPLPILGSNIKFVGIAMTDSNSSPMDGNRPVVTTTVQIGGTNTILNTGEAKICAGDIVCWDIPTPEELSNRSKRVGLHPEKAVLKTVPFHAVYKDFTNILEQNWGMVTPSDVITELKPDKNGLIRKMPQDNVCEFVSKMKYLVSYIYLVSRPDDTDIEPGVKNSDIAKTLLISPKSAQYVNDAYERVFPSTGRAGDPTDLQYKVFATKLLDAMMTAQTYFDDRIIGRAVSAAGKGEKFDIYLNR